jgi:sodium transport system permease protein
LENNEPRDIFSGRKSLQARSGFTFEAANVPGIGEVLFVYLAVLGYALLFGFFPVFIDKRWESVCFTLGIGFIPLFVSLLSRHSFKTVYKIRSFSFSAGAGGLLFSTGMFMSIFLITGILSFFFSSLAEAENRMRGKMLDENTVRLIFSVVLLPAICEEFLFRGFILSGLAKVSGKWVAIFVCSVFFGLLHLDLWQGFFAFAAGIGLSYAAYETGSVFVPLIMHSTYNLAVLLMGTRGAGKIVPDVHQQIAAVFSGGVRNSDAFIMSCGSLSLYFCAILTLGCSLLYAGFRLLKKNKNRLIVEFSP